MYDLLKTVEYGGCSTKISAGILENALKGLLVNRSISTHSTEQGEHTHFDIRDNLLVGNDTHDDAAVYKLNDEQAIIFTTDFFPPVCSDPFTFGQIAAANAMSDVYAMGGKVLLALNLIMFPSKKIPIDVLPEILKGGEDKVREAEALIVGGHTIDDFPPKYGLAVVGLIHPQKIITNSNAKAGDVLILTKPLGIGTILAAKRLDMISEKNYQKAIDNMKQLNKEAARIMNRYDVTCATDITGFGLLGHLVKMANGSSVSIRLDIDSVPFLDGALELIENGCIPGAAFRNKEYVENQSIAEEIIPALSIKKHYNKTMMLYDPQTSGGMAICVPAKKANDMLKELKMTYPESAIIGQIEERN